MRWLGQIIVAISVAVASLLGFHHVQSSPNTTSMPVHINATSTTDAIGQRTGKDTSPASLTIPKSTNGQAADCNDAASCMSWCQKNNFPPVCEQLFKTYGSPSSNYKDAGSNAYKSGSYGPVAQNQTPPSNQALQTNSSAAVQAGWRLGGQQCTGTGPGTLTHAAMDPSDYAYIIPYGLMVGGHVTPVDHQYYAVSRNSARDAYPVYAMGDAHIVAIEHRTQSPGDNQYVLTHKTDEYRVVFSQSCTFFYYYDLLTSLAPDIERQYEAAGGQMDVSVDIPVKSGQVIGHIGGQTLDFAVWNTQKPLWGFVVPAHYNGEPWKLYVADPLDYYSADLKTMMLSRYPRIDQPLSGKIDWDVDGKLRGNWFLQGTGGVNSNRQNPWENQVAFAPDLYDPSRFVISMGNYGATSYSSVSAQQFYAKGNAPDPASVGVDSGLIKYELVTGSYQTPSGGIWDRNSFAKGLKVVESATVAGTVLVQMIDARTLKFEAFPGKTAAEVSGFDSGAEVYIR